MPWFLDQQDIGIRSLKECVEKCTLSVYVNQDNLYGLCNHWEGVGVTWMGRQPETTSMMNAEYSACSCEELKTSSEETPFVCAHSVMFGTTFIMGTDGGGVSSTRAGVEDIDGRGGKDSIPSAVG